MASVSILLLVLTGLFIIAKYIFSYFQSNAPNPFENATAKLPQPHVQDPKERDAVLKQGFKLEYIPSDLDAIVIGSGIGGLCTAAILSKVGKKVLVLEQHDQAGGCCHTFIEKGYEFDVGIHYIGSMHFQSPSKTLLDQISDGQIEWEQMSSNFDTVVFKDEDSVRKYPVYAGFSNWKAELKKSFPEEEKAIEKFFELVKEVSKTYASSYVVKMIPVWLVSILVKLNLLKYITKFYEWNSKSVKEIIEELTSNQELRDIFSYCFADYGTTPSKAGFPILSGLISHFKKGAAYPVGGASEIAFNIIPVIERSGGRVLVRAKVSEIMLNEYGNASGVKVKHGSQETLICAPLVISDAGVFNTFGSLLPVSVSQKLNVTQLTQKKEHGMGTISLFVGFDASAEELDIPIKKNYWVFTKPNTDKATNEYLSLPVDKVEDSDVPLLFISFPSTKDPTWNDRYPGKSTMAIVTVASYSWFQEWAKQPVMRRGDDYEAFKKTIADKIMKHAEELFPKIKDHIDYLNVGTPLSNNFYLGAPQGEIYGLDHDMQRFSPMWSAQLRPRTEVPGLYLTGQDVCSCGFGGALWGGVFCAQSVLGRNILNDLTNLHTCIIKTNDKKKQ